MSLKMRERTAIRWETAGSNRMNSSLSCPTPSSFCSVDDTHELPSQLELPSPCEQPDVTSTGAGGVGMPNSLGACTSDTLSNIVADVSDECIFHVLRPCSRRFYNFVCALRNRKPRSGGHVEIVCTLAKNIDKTIVHAVKLAEQYPGIRFNLRLLQGNNFVMEVAPHVINGIGALRSLEMHHSKKLSHSLIEQFSKLQKLVLHRVHGCSGYFNLLTTIPEISLSRLPDVTDDDIMELTEVRCLELGYMEELTDRSMKHIVSLKSLVGLQLIGMNGVTDDTFACLITTNKKEMRLSLCTMNHLPAKSIRDVLGWADHVHLSDMHICKSMIALHKCPRNLVLSNIVKLPREIFRYLGNYGVSVHFRDLHVRDNDTMFLRNLDTLTLDGIPSITSEGIERLTGVKKLRLKRIPRLDKLNVSIGRHLHELVELVLGDLVCKSDFIEALLAAVTEDIDNLKLEKIVFENALDLELQTLLLLEALPTLKSIEVVKPCPKVAELCPLVLKANGCRVVVVEYPESGGVVGMFLSGSMV